MTDTATGLTDAEAVEFRRKCIDFMEQYFHGRPEEQFVDPGGIEMVAIDKTTGLVASEDCPPASVFLESFVEGNRPATPRQDDDRSHRSHGECRQADRARPVS